MATPLSSTDSAPPPPSVALAACPDYHPETLAKALDRALALLPDGSTPFRPGQSVLLKPNLLSDHSPEQAVTTHPAFVRAVIHHFRDLDLRLSVADSPAGAGQLEKVWQVTGIADICHDAKIPLINLEKAGSRAVVQNGFRFHVALPILEADHIVNLPKVKTHVLTTLTCAVKNLYGTIPGYLKAQLHKQYPWPGDFGRLVRAVHDARPPTLNLADGILGMQGNGPANGDPIHLGFIAASTSAPALDRCLCHLLGIPPQRVPYLTPISSSLPGDRLGFVAVGDDPATLRPTAFALPRPVPTWRIPDWMLNRITPWIWFRPAFNTACIRCERCVRSCPTEALGLAPGAAKPTLIPERCIGCCCCHEICPARAIDMRPSPLLRTWSRLRRGLSRK